MPIDPGALLTVFADAVATRQGFYKPAGRFQEVSRSLANPGCLKRWKSREGIDLPQVNGFVSFTVCNRRNCRDVDHPLEAGWRALRIQCRINIVKRGLTWREFFAGRRGLYEGFSARDGNDPIEDALFVMGVVLRRLGLTDGSTNLDAKISRLLE